MSEKNAAENSQLKKERFEFVFTVNGNIICQRYFRINNLNDKALDSVKLSDAVNECAEIIKNDLKAKTNIYGWYTSPQIFDNENQMNTWLKKNGSSLEMPTYICLRDSDINYVWDGDKAIVYDKPIDKSIYTNPLTEGNYIFKFAFLDNGIELYSHIWNGDVYPKFVRNNIDLTNSKNKYDNNDSYAPMESLLMSRFVASHEDIIPVLVETICKACTSTDNSDYYPYLEYGDRKYPINIKRANRRYIRNVEAQYRKKTEAYFKNV